MPVIDVILPVQGTTLPTDHGYALYSALTALVPDFHVSDYRLRFAPIAGIYAGNGLLQLNDRSRLRCRLTSERISSLLPLAGKRIEIAGYRVTLGVPHIAALVPAASLSAKIVTFKHSTDPGRFLEAARTKLAEMKIQGEPQIPLICTGRYKGEPRRRILRVKGKRVVGFACTVMGLTADESSRLQEQGLGGRTRMGCGFFLPSKPEAE